MQNCSQQLLCEQNEDTPFNGKREYSQDLNKINYVLGYIFLQLFLLALLVVLPSKGEYTCNDEIQVTLSMLDGLKYARLQKIQSLQDVVAELNKMEDILNSTLEEDAKLQRLIQNLTTPETENSYTCENIQRDCCQVMNNFILFLHVLLDIITVIIVGIWRPLNFANIQLDSKWPPVQHVHSVCTVVF